MDTQTYEYQSDFARHYGAVGKAEGRAELILRQLTCRFGQIDAQTQTLIQRSLVADLDAIGERLLTARTLQQALGTQAAE